LSLSRFLDRDVAAAAGSTQTLLGQQTRGALTQRVVGQLIAAGQVAGRQADCCSGQVPGSIIEQQEVNIQQSLTSIT
jgi:hypothetical protein